MKPLMFTLPFLLLVPAHGTSININLYNSEGTVGSNQVEGEETAGLIPIAGNHWNNIGFSNGNISGDATHKNQAVKDDSGNTSAATFISTLNSAFVGYSGATQGTGTVGSRDMMNSYLSFKPSDGGNLQVTGLGNDFTKPGYKVYVYFDTDSTNRPHTLKLTPSGAAPVAKAGNDSGTYSGTFVTATGSSHYANVAVFENVTASSFTLTMDSNASRVAVNAIQIVSNDHTSPPTIESFTVNDCYVTPGTAVNLNWQTTYATSITIDRMVGNVTSLSTDGNGSTSATVNVTTTFTLTATNSSGSTTRTVRVGAGPARPNILFFHRR